jgi:hypothetical protein
VRALDRALLGLVALGLGAALVRGIGASRAAVVLAGSPTTHVAGHFAGRLHEGVDPLQPPGLPEGVEVDPDTGRLRGLRPAEREGVESLVWEDLTLPEELRDLADVPPAVAARAGGRIALVGFVSPAFDPVAFRHFFLVASTYVCCFGREPALHEIVEVRLARDATPLDMDPRPYQVEGVLRLEPIRMPATADGRIILLFHLDEARAFRVPATPR